MSVTTILKFVITVRDLFVWLLSFSFASASHEASKRYRKPDRGVLSSHICMCERNGHCHATRSHAFLPLDAKPSPRLRPDHSSRPSAALTCRFNYSMSSLRLVVDCRPALSPEQSHRTPPATPSEHRLVLPPSICRSAWSHAVH